MFEVVVASSILFLVATALLGLLGASTSISATATANTIAVNQMNSLLEWVSTVAYDQVTPANLNARANALSGRLNGIDLVVTATVTDRWFATQNQSTAPPAFKQVTVTVRAQPPIGRPFTVSSTTNIRRGGTASAETTGSGTPGTGTGPTVERLANSPADDAVVWGTSVAVGVRGRSGAPEIQLRSIEMSARGSRILWEETTASVEETTGVWNTTLLQLDGTRRWPDGRTEMRAQVWDALGRFDDLAWNVFVDNVSAASPTGLAVAAVVGNSSVTYSWQEGDLADPALSYRVRWDRLRTDGTREPVESMPTAPSALLSTAPFSRYQAIITARGPRAHFNNHAGSESLPVTSAWYISRPSMAGSTVTIVEDGRNNRAARLNIALRCDAPTFLTTGTTTYVWQARYGSGAWATLGTTTNVATFTNTNWPAPVNGRFGDRGVQFRVLVTVTPSGGTAVAVPSAVQPFAGDPPVAGTPDWTRWANPPATPAIDWNQWRL